MRRLALVLLLATGAALIAAPLVLSMPGRSNDGADMVDDFRPIMQPVSVEKTVEYYGLFQGLGTDFGSFMNEEKVATFQGYMKGLGAMQEELPQMLSALGKQLGMTPAQMQRFLGEQFPAVAQGLAAMPQMGRDFSDVVGVMAKDAEPFAGVEPALTHYGDLVDRMERNVGNYSSVDELPAMSAFSWFFFVPGALIVLLSGWLLATSARPAVSGAVVPEVAG